MMLDRFTQHTVDPLTLMSNVSHQQYYSQSSTTPLSTLVPPHITNNTQLDSGLSPTDNLIENLTNTLALLTQSYKTYLPQTNNQLKTSSNTRNQAIFQDGRVGNAIPCQARQIKCYNCNGQENGVALDEEQLLFIAGGQDNVVDEDVVEQPVQDLAHSVDNVFQADDCDAFDSDVDEAPIAQTMFMANLSSADPVYDEAGLSYDSNILSEVHDHDHYQDAVCEHHEEHEMQDDVQLNYVVDSHADYTSDSNMIPYDQYVKDNAVPVVQSNVSSVPNDAYMVILNKMYEQPAQYVSGTTQNTVVDKSLTAELATYKEQVELYERRARFELTEREQKIDEQLRIASNINHNKSMVEEVTSLKKDFKQKENKYLEEFLDMKALKEKVEDKLYKQDQSLQTVHMLCKPKPYYDEQNKVAIGYKNYLCLTRAKQVQPALYNGHEIIKTNHVPAIVHNTEDNLKIAKMTRKKMKDPACVNHKVKIAPPDYSKENYLTTFTPQKQLTPEQIFWSQDLIKMKAEALKKQTTASRPIKVLAVYPPNTPATLVPRMLLTKSHVKINIFTLIQLFSEFEKTCKKRITPTGSLKGKGVLKKPRNVISPRGPKDYMITHLTEKVNVLQEQNELFRAENEKVKQHYKELYDSIKITRAKHIEQTTALITKNKNLKAQILQNLKCNTIDYVKPRVLVPGRYAIDVELIPPHNRNNRKVHLDYLKHLKKSVETLREIVEEAKVERPLDRLLASACLYTKLSQELLEYVIGTCPKDFNPQNKKHVATPLIRKKQVTFANQCETSNNNAHKHVEHLNLQQTNFLVPPSTGVNSCTDASRSQPRNTTKKNRILSVKSVNKKKVEEHPRTNKSSLRTTNRVDSIISSKRTVINSNSHSVSQTCNKCLISANHDVCVVDYLHSVNASPLLKMLHGKLSKFGNLSNLGKCGKPQAKCLPVLVINGGPGEEYSF
ncbi:hypothetical protein Tco_0778040 [Tanacetum coccineum]